MIISHKYKFIYIKCPKVAGTSTEVFLEQFCSDQDIVTRVRPLEGDWKHKERNCEGFFNHIKPLEIKQKITDEVFSNYFKFCNIRNPWDRCVSFYFWKKVYRKDTRSFNELFDQDGFHSLKEFYTINDEEVMDDYIRYETLEADIHRILDKLKIPHNKNLELPKAKVLRKNKEYKSYFNETRKNKIAEICKDEINRFKYEF